MLRLDGRFAHGMQRHACAVEPLLQARVEHCVCEEKHFKIQRSPFVHVEIVDQSNTSNIVPITISWECVPCLDGVECAEGILIAANCVSEWDESTDDITLTTS